MSIIRKNYRLIFLVVFFLTIMVFVFIKFKLLENKYEVVENNDLETTNIDSKQEKSTTCMIDIKGAIKNPGVYTTSCNDNVSDQTTPNMIQRLNDIFARNPLIYGDI